MKIAYLYPEKLPSKKARAISVINTSCELSKIVDTTLIYEKSENDILSFYNLNCDLKLKQLSRKFIIRSNKIFNFNLKKEINNFDYFYVRHLKTAEFLIKNGANVIYECHEIFRVKNKKVKDIEDFVIKNSKGLVFINKFLQTKVQEFFNFQIPSIIARNGCGFEVEFIKKDFSKIDEVYYIGSFYKWKGVDFLIENLNNENIKLNIIGDGDRKEELIKKSSQNIQFLGYKNHNEIVEYLKKSKITIIPNIPSSDSEFSTPIKLYEYLMTSNIVLASDFEPIKEIIKDGVNGFLFKAGNKEDFNKKLDYILSLPKEKLEEISKNAYNTGKKFTWMHRANDIIDFIEGIKENI